LSSSNFICGNYSNNLPTFRRSTPVENIQAAFSKVVKNPDYPGMDFEVIAGAMEAIACHMMLF
jgi:hypothetical protein